jgi:hypothetical protein
MLVEIIVRIDGREVAAVKDELATWDSLALEEETEKLKDRVGRVVLEEGFRELAAGGRHPCCCGRCMEHKGLRGVTIDSHSGPIRFTRPRYRCRVCGAWQTPADAEVCCGRHRITRLLARNVCQLATLDHFTHLEQLMADQHGVHLGHEAMLELVHDAGGAADAKRLAEVEHWEQLDADRKRWPEPDVTPHRVYVSCDGIMYCTNESEPDPLHPGQRRLIWKQMRVGCVYWQDDRERWHKQVVWGQDEDFLTFGASLYRVACRCGYRQAAEKIFAADGGDWCWTIHQKYFADAWGVLDWYHVTEHVWSCGKVLHDEPDGLKAWGEEALGRLRQEGGHGLCQWLLTQLAAHRGRSRAALQKLYNYLHTRGDSTDYPTYRAKDWQIGTGMIESTAKQLVGQRLKGPGMHWSPEGATAITALRAQDLNGVWHTFWKNLRLAA